MITTVCKISYGSQTVPPIVPAVQGDTGRAISFEIADFTPPAGATATYFILKPSGEAIYNSATITNNSILCELTAQSLAEAGENRMQVRVLLGENIVTSFEVILMVRTFLGDDAMESGTEMNIFDQAVEQATEQFQENAEQIVAEVIESIPADYTELTEEVDELNERLDKDEGATYADSVSIDKINFTLSDAIRNNYWFRIDLEADVKYQIKNLSDATIAIATSNTTSIDASDVTINNGLSSNNTIQFTLNASKKYLRIFFGVTQGSTGTVNVELSRTDALRPRVDTLESDVSSTQNAVGMFVSLNVNDYVVAFDGHYINANTGEVASIASNNWGVSDYIPVFPSGKVAVYATDGTNVVQETGAYYDTNKQLISGMGRNKTGAEKTFDVPSNCYYIRLSLNKLGIFQTTVKVQNTVNQVAYQSQIDNIMDILESINPGSKWNDKDCVQIGDSITWYDGHVNTAGETVKGYAYYLRQIFHSVDNQGVSGASIALHSGGVTDVCETVDTIDFGDYAFVTIAGGINDCQYQDSPMGAYTTGTTYDRTTFYGAYQYILDKIYTDNPTIQILIFTPMKSRATDNGWQNQEGNTLLDYVDAVLDIAKKYSIPVLNLYDISGINKYTYNSYTLDGLHPNNAGYAELSGKLISAVESL